MAILHYVQPNDEFPDNAGIASCSLGTVGFDGHMYICSDFKTEFKSRAYLTEVLTIFHECVHILKGHHKLNIRGENTNLELKCEVEVWECTAKVIGLKAAHKALVALGPGKRQEKIKKLLGW